MKRILITGLLMAGLGLCAQDFSANKISQDLKDGADAVIRSEREVLTIHSVDHATLEVYRAVTILNAREEDQAEIRLPYSSFIDLSDIEARVYANSGKLIQKLKRKDIQDLARYDGYTVASDSRYKYFDLRQGRGPYTIEVSYTLDFSGTMNLPDWYAFPGFRTAVEQSEFILKHPPELNVRYMAEGLGDPVMATLDEMKVLTWRVEDLSGLKPIPYGPSFSKRAPKVLVAMGEFQMEEYRGSMSSWQSFGQWQNQLLDDVGGVSSAVVYEALAQIADAPTFQDSVKRLYEYMQGRTRYVSIQLGIGGWQPFEPSFVHENQYGDCKALSYYMHTLLDAVGITSHYALVRARASASPILTEFPSNQFNHAILCVPEPGKDTLWLECTSQTNPFAFLGTFTDDRNVLLITPEGGKIARTTRYPFSVNREQFAGTFAVNEEGTAEGELNQSYRGLRYDHRGLSSVLRESQEEINEWVMSSLGWSGWFLKEITTETRPGAIPEAELNLRLAAPGVATLGGSRLFLNPCIREAVEVPVPDLNRSEPILLRRGYIKEDSLVYQVPGNYRLEYLPSEVEITAPFGSYRASYIMEGNQLTYRRELLVLGGSFEAKQYQAWRKFWQQVAKADQEQVVLVDNS
ncbi:MAG: DUF3857 domain-containing protein [Bacteroidota bacterium]